MTLTFFINTHNLTADVDIFERLEFVGKRIGYEAYTAGTRYLFEVCGMRKATGDTFIINAKMVKIFGRLRFALEGVRKRQEIVCSQEVDTLLFGKFNV